MERRFFFFAVAAIVLSCVAVCAPQASQGATLARVNFDFYDLYNSFVGTGWLQFGLEGFEFDTWYNIASELTAPQQKFIVVNPYGGQQGVVLSPPADAWSAAIKIVNQDPVFLAALAGYYWLLSYRGEDGAGPSKSTMMDPGTLAAISGSTTST